MTCNSSVSRHRLVFSGLTLLVILALSPVSFATIWTVDRANPQCDDAGPGDTVEPFCMIKPAASAALAGDRVVVHRGVYREQVDPPRSGQPGAPIVYRASGAGVVILGTDALSDPGGWSLTATTAWSRPFSPSSATKQVFVDGKRLILASSALTTTPGSFFYDADFNLLFVDLGGPNPADGHVVEAGARTYGFKIASGRSFIRINGFEIYAQNHTGIRLFSASNEIYIRSNIIADTGVYGISLDGVVGPAVIADNHVSTAASVGIRLQGATKVLVRRNRCARNGFHGISLMESSDNRVEANVSYGNEKPGVRSANGINVSSMSMNNVVIANVTFDNQDTGIQVYTGSQDNLVARNLSYRNGDHGFDTNGAVRTRYISNTAYGNFKDGFSIEGNSTETTVVNNIAVDNGLDTGEFDLLVDPTSTLGFESDYNIFWKSVPGTVVRFNGVFYSALADFVAATGQETHGIQDDPRFDDPENGNFRVGLGPAVDSADSGVAGFVLEDFAGVEPIDIATVVDTGAGDPAYADRGAFEYIDSPPKAYLSLQPRRGRAPLTVTADASRSRDNDGIVSYLFDFGDGTTVGPQSESKAVHTFTVKGLFRVTVTVIDTAGQKDSAAKEIRIHAPRRHR